MSYLLYLSICLFLFSNYSIDIRDSTIISIDRNTGFTEFKSPKPAILNALNKERQEDTLFIDDQGISGYYFMPQNGYYAQKFTPGVECTLKSATVITYDIGDTCYFFVWKDSLGLPGSPLLSWLPFIGTYPMEWQRIDFPVPLVVSEDVWAGIRAPCPPYPVVDSIGHYERMAISLLPPIWTLKDKVDPELKIRLIGSFTGIRQDVSIKNIYLSEGPLLPNPSNLAVSGTVINYGNSVEKNFDISIDVFDSLSQIIFCDTHHIDSLQHLQEDTISFQWYCTQNGDYIVALQTLLLNDCMKDNDTSFTEAHILSYPSEFYYDDNTFEAGLGIGIEDIFALEFTPPYYPCCIESFKIHMESFGGPVDTFQYIAMILDDDGILGAPGTIIGQDTITGVYNGWNSVNLKQLGIEIDSGCFYAGYSPLMSLPNVTLHGDRDLPFVYLSWYYRQSTNEWVRFSHSNYDPGIRVFVDYPNAVSEDVINTNFKNLFSISPSVSNGKFKCSFSTSKDCRVDIALYSLDGRKIKCLFGDYVKKGFHNFYPNIGSVPQGIYFIRLRCANFEAIEKFIIIR